MGNTKYLVMIGLLTWLIVPLFNAWMDRKGAKRNYLIVNILRGIAMLVHSVIFFHPHGGYNILSDLWKGLPYIIFYFTSYWIVFEVALNIMQGRIKQLGWEGLLYYDQVEKDSGVIDRFFVGKEELHFWAKFLAALACVICAMVIVYRYEVTLVHEVQ